MAIPLGRWFGVHLRLHALFLLLLALSAGYSVALHGSATRGIALWLALCAAVLVRELARAIAAAYAGAPLRALFLLPFGGVMALEPRRGGLPRSSQRLIAAAGTAANLLAALLLLGFAYGVAPGVALFRQPWISAEHILRSAVWLQVLLGLINLVPTRGLPVPSPLRRRMNSVTGPKVQSEVQNASMTGAARARRGLAPGARLRNRPAFGLLTALALSLVLSGIVTAMLWPVLLGLTVLFTQGFGRMAAVAGAETSTLTVRDVMITEYTPLSAAGTLRDALLRTTHSLQDAFPVIRGDRLVGWISRNTLTNRLQLEGDGYLQGSMVRSLQFATPDEKLGEALRRAATLGASEFIPVVEDGAMVGILTPSGLERAVSQMRLTQPQPERGQA